MSKTTHPILDYEIYWYSVQTTQQCTVCNFYHNFCHEAVKQKHQTTKWSKFFLLGAFNKAFQENPICDLTSKIKFMTTFWLTINWVVLSKIIQNYIEQDKKS